MDYIRIKTTSQRVNESTGREAESQSRRATEPMANSQQLTINDIKELLKDWIKLYPNSFAPDVELKIYQLEDGDIIIRLHEDMSSLAVALLVLYLESTSQQVNKSTSIDAESQSRKDAELTANSQQPIAYITIDDTEVLLKQNEGKRAMIVGSQQTTDNVQRSSSASVRFILEDNYCLDYDFEKRAKPAKNTDITFNEEEINLPENYVSVKVGDVIKSTVDKVLEEEGLTPKKMLVYLLCGVIGLSIGFLIVYFMGR